LPIRTDNFLRIIFTAVNHEHGTDKWTSVKSGCVDISFYSDTVLIFTNNYINVNFTILTSVHIFCLEMQI